MTIYHEPYHEQVQTECSTKFPNGTVHVSYGLSKVALNMSGKDVVGQLLSCYRVKIIDDDGNRRGINENGEICIRCRYKFLCYFGNQNATNEVFDDEGFFLIGDIGHFDENGDLTIVDRKKELI